MKKLFPLLTLCLALLMVACQQQNNASQTDHASQTEIETENTPQTEDEPGNLVETNTSDKQDYTEDDISDTGADNNVAEATKLYYGTWNVTSNIFYAPVSALSPEEIEQLQGTTITYEENRLLWNGEICDIPDYQENTETSVGFALDYNNRLTFSDLGLTGSEATAVSVDNWDAFGSYFYVKDENTLIISYNGVFFEASRNLNGTQLSPTEAKEKAQLYEGIYFDNRLFGDSDRENYPITTYEIVISNITDTAFDFAVYEITVGTGESSLIFPKYTAVFSGDGTEATFNGDEYNLTFVFPDYHETYPVVTDIEISGFTPFEGKTYVNNSIPGYEFG